MECRLQYNIFKIYYLNVVTESCSLIVQNLQEVKTFINSQTWILKLQAKT